MSNLASVEAFAPQTNSYTVFNAGNNQASCSQQLTTALNYYTGPQWSECRAFFNLLFRGNKKDGLVYGTIGLTNLGNNEVKGYFDDYDFDIRPWNSAGNVIRNIETKIGDWKAGNGPVIEFTSTEKEK